MSAKDYMRVNPDNTVTINLNSYTGKAFADAIKVRDIAQVRILNKQEKKGRKNGEPDVMIMRASGEVGYISRQDLVKNYVYLSGKKIVIPYMKSNKRYMVTRNCNQPYGVMLLPTNMTAVFNGKPVRYGTYIVAPKNQDGSIDYSNIHTISRQMFRKVFKIPNQDVIIRNMGRGGNRSSRIANKVSNRKSFISPYGRSGIKVNLGTKPQIIPATGLNNPNEQLRPIVNTNPAENDMNRLQQAQIAQHQQRMEQQKQTKYPYRAVGLIVNDNQVTVGYKIEDTKGNVRNVNKQTVMNMCAKKLISNLMLTTHSSGTVYIRGNGIREESLPKYMV